MLLLGKRSINITTLLSTPKSKYYSHRNTSRVLIMEDMRLTTHSAHGCTDLERMMKLDQRPRPGIKDSNISIIPLVRRAYLLKKNYQLTHRRPVEKL